MAIRSPMICRENSSSLIKRENHFFACWISQSNGWRRWPTAGPAARWKTEQPVTIVSEEEKPAGNAQRLGVVFNFNHDPFPGFSLDAVTGESNEEQSSYTGKVEKMDLTKFVNTDLFNEFDRQLVPSLRKMQVSEINKFLNRNSPFSGIWENIIHHEEDDLPEETKKLMVEYLHPKLKKLFAEVNANPFVFLSQRPQGL